MSYDPHADMKGPFIQWTMSDYGYTPHSFATLEEALKAETYGGSFVITKVVDWTAKEKPDGVRRLKLGERVIDGRTFVESIDPDGKAYLDQISN